MNSQGWLPSFQSSGTFYESQGFLKATSGRSVKALVPWGTALGHYPKGEGWEGEALLKAQQKLLA